jgi:hypothetical protein
MAFNFLKNRFKTRNIYGVLLEFNHNRKTFYQIKQSTSDQTKSVLVKLAHNVGQLHQLKRFNILRTLSIIHGLRGIHLSRAFTTLAVAAVPQPSPNCFVRPENERNEW